MKKKYDLYKKRILITGIIIILVSLSAQLLLYRFEKMKEKELVFDSLEWSEFCDGKIYTPEEKKDFCQKCLNGTDTCDWPLDMNLQILNAESVVKTGGEIHCYNEIDGINYYTEKGRYFGITQKTLFTWEVLDASKAHNIHFCCWIERKNIVSSMLSLENTFPTACVSSSATPRCTP